MRICARTRERGRGSRIPTIGAEAKSKCLKPSAERPRAGPQSKGPTLSAWLRQATAPGELLAETDRRRCSCTRASLTSMHPSAWTHEAGEDIVASFTRQRKNGVTMNILPFETQTQIIGWLT